MITQIKKTKSQFAFLSAQAREEEKQSQSDYENNIKVEKQLQRLKDHIT